MASQPDQKPRLLLLLFTKWIWDVEEILTYAHFICNFADPLTSLELLNYNLTLAMRSAGLAYYVI